MKITWKMFDNVSVVILFFHNSFIFSTSGSFVSECHYIHELGKISENHSSDLRFGEWHNCSSFTNSCRLVDTISMRYDISNSDSILDRSFCYADFSLD